jgi:hypothetical protein
VPIQDWCWVEWIFHYSYFKVLYSWLFCQKKFLLTLQFIGKVQGTPQRGRDTLAGTIFVTRIEKETNRGIFDLGIVPQEQLRDSGDSRVFFEGFEFEVQKEEQIVFSK